MSERGTCPILEDTFVAEEALTQYQAVVYGSTAGGIAAPSASGDVAAGIVQDDAAASGDPIRVLQMGKSKIIAKYTISVGDQLQIADTDGRLGTPTAWASGDGFVGTAEEAASASGDIVTAYINVRTLNR